MHRNAIVVGTILALSTPAVQADWTDSPKLVGRVTSHYVQVARGVFIEARIAVDARTAPRWADVQPVNGAPAMLAHTPEGVLAAVGLLVEVRRGRVATRTFPVAETPTVDRPAADQRAGTGWLTSSQ